MVDLVTVLTFVLACSASAFMAWAIGAGSSGSTPFAPAVGANAIPVMQAAFIVGIFGLLGAVLQGQNVSQAVGRELVSGVSLTPETATIALMLAGLLVAIGVFTGYPIATAFTVTGAVIGVGLASGGVPMWDKWVEIATLWVFTPFIAGGIAYGLARFLRKESVSDRTTVPFLAGVVCMMVVNLEFLILGAGEDGASIAQTIAGMELINPETGSTTIIIAVTLFFGIAGAFLLQREMDRDVTRGEHRFLLALGALVAFSAGGSQVGLAVGPLLPLLDPYQIAILPILIGGGVGLLIGSWTGAPRMIKAIAQDYSSLGPRRSIAALIPSFIIAQIAILYGIPVSFNEIIVSSVVGSGYVTGSSGVSRRKMVNTVIAWFVALTLAGLLGYGFVILFQNITGM